MSEIPAVVVTVPSPVGIQVGIMALAGVVERSVGIAGRCLLYGEESEATAVLSSDKVRFLETISPASMDGRTVSR